MLFGILIFIHIAICFGLVGVVLLQSGRGGGLAGIGGGGAASVLGGRGATDALSTLTQGLAIGFMVSSILLAFTSSSSLGEDPVSVIANRGKALSMPATQALLTLPDEEGSQEALISLPPAPEAEASDGIIFETAGDASETPATEAPATETP